MIEVPDFDLLVLKGKSKLIAAYSYVAQEHLGLTQAQSADLLVKSAFQEGILDSERCLLGETLSAWGRGSNKVPFWALCASIELLVKRAKWTPNSDALWAVFSSVMLRCENKQYDLSYFTHTERHIYCEFYAAAKSSQISFKRAKGGA